jgi:Tfp pilus assembly protein PilN
MATINREINLLPSKWGLPNNLRLLETKLKWASLFILGIYIVVIFGLFGWFGILVVRRAGIKNDADTAARQLNSYRQLEASEAVLKDKANFAVEVLGKQLNAGLAVEDLLTLVPATTIQILGMTISQQGKVNLSGSASSSASLSAYLGSFESKSGFARQIFQKAIGSFDIDSTGKSQFTVNLEFAPTAARTEVEGQ